MYHLNPRIIWIGSILYNVHCESYETNLKDRSWEMKEREIVSFLNAYTATERDGGFLHGRLRANALCQSTSAEPRWLLSGRAGCGAAAGLGSSWSAMWHCCYC